LKVPKGGKRLSRATASWWLRSWSGWPDKTVLARELIEVLAAAVSRDMHVVGNGAHLRTELRRLPQHVTSTGPLPPMPTKPD
jgi:hypothetical protein